MKKVTKP